MSGYVVPDITMLSIRTENFKGMFSESENCHEAFMKNKTKDTTGPFGLIISFPCERKFGSALVWYDVTTGKAIQATMNFSCPCCTLAGPS